jgi:hypothetical protein
MVIEREIQNALGTLKIYEILSIFPAAEASGPFRREYIPERWVKASCAAEAIILTLQQEPHLANDFGLYAIEQSQVAADDWEDLSPYGLDYYLNN